MQEALRPVGFEHEGWGARVLQPRGSGHLVGVTWDLYPINNRYVGLGFWDVGQGLLEDAAG
jgi:hypothetical protein